MAVPTLRFDLRRTPFAETSQADLYVAALDMCAWADERGFPSVVVSEHHGVRDGYCPAPLVLAAAIGGRTQRITITVSALIVPLHDPLHLAEEIAVADLATGGRLSIVAGIGYRHEEFEMFGVDRSRRGAIVELVFGRVLTVQPGFDAAIEQRLASYYDDLYGVPHSAFDVPAHAFAHAEPFETVPCVR